VSWRSATLLVWALLAVAAVVLWLLAVGGWGRIARLGVALRPLVAGRIARSAVVLGWMWLGWHFFAR